MTATYMTPGAFIEADSLGIEPGTPPLRMYLLASDGSRRIVRAASMNVSSESRVRTNVPRMVGWIVWQQRVNQWPRPVYEGAYLPYPTADDPTPEPVPEPTNQMAYVTPWRDYLSRIATELHADHPLDHALYLTRPHEGFTLGDPIPESAHERNRAMTRHLRITVGELWREMHVWAQFDPAIFRWRASLPTLTAKMEHLHVSTERRGWIARMHDSIDPPAVQAALDAGQRIDFSTSTLPWGVEDEPGSRPLGFVEQAEAVDNFRRAREYRYHDNGDGSTAPMQFSGGIPTGMVTSYNSAAYAVSFWRSVIGLVTDFTDAQVHAWQRWCKLNLLASMRLSNWDDPALAEKLKENQLAVVVDLVGTFGVAGRDMAGVLRSTTEPWWSSGFVVWDPTDMTLSRDALPWSNTPDADPLNAPQDVVATGDWRVATHVVVIARDEIERSDSATTRASTDPWLREAFWTAWVERELHLAPV